MHQELDDLVTELKITGKSKKFYDIEKFLKHIFEWEKKSEYRFEGYHSEYLYPNLFNLYVSKKFPGGVYQVHFRDENNIKTNGSNMFPKNLSPKELVDIILNNLTDDDYTKGCVDFEYKGMIVRVSFKDEKIFSAFPNTHYK